MGIIFNYRDLGGTEFQEFLKFGTLILIIPSTIPDLSFQYPE